MSFDPNAPFDVLDAPAAPAAPAAEFDPGAPFEVATPPPSSLGRRFAMGVGDVVAGALNFPGNAAAAVANVPIVGLNALAGREVIPEFRYDVGRQVATGVGLPAPVTPEERIVSRVNEGGAGMIAPLGAARAIQGAAGVTGLATAQPPRTVGQAVTGALANSPGTDLAAGAVGGGVGGAIEQAGGNVVSQVAGDVAGNIITAAIIAAVARRRGIMPDAVRPESITPEESAAAWRDPDVQRVAEANGITDPADPRVPQLEARLGAARAAEAAPVTARIEDQASRPPPPAGAEGGNRGLRADIAQERAAAAAAVERIDAQVGREAAAAAEAGRPYDAAAARARLLAAERAPREPVPGTVALPDQTAAIPRTRRDTGDRVTEPPLRGTADPNAVPFDPARLRSEDVAAEQAFRQAEAQRQRAGAEVRDTQPAPRPEGVAPQTVYLDQGFPVRVIGRDDQGFVSVERYDPRTGAPDPDAVPYVVRENTLQQRQYAAQPRAAQDFTARSGSPRDPEMPRDAGPGAPAQEPRQTYRTTAPDPVRNDAAAGPADPFDPTPPGRQPFPEQPPGSSGRRWSSAEEAERDFQARRAQQEDAARQARERGEWNANERSTNTPGAQDADGRWPTGANGYVTSSTGGPIIFGDQKQAARWILREGQAKSPDQFFEIAVHPSGQGFTVREAGRNAGSRASPDQGGSSRGDGRAAGGAEGTRPPPAGGAAQEVGAPPRVTFDPQQGAADAGPAPTPPPRPPEAPPANVSPEAPSAVPEGVTPDDLEVLRRNEVSDAELKGMTREEVAETAAMLRAGESNPDAPVPRGFRDGSLDEALGIDRGASPPADDIDARAAPSKAERAAAVSALRQAGVPDAEIKAMSARRQVDEAARRASGTPPPPDTPAPRTAEGAGDGTPPSGGGPRLYSNPLADPEAWRRFLIDPITGTARALRDRLKGSVTGFGTTPGVGAFWRLHVDSARATLLHYQDKYASVPGMRELVTNLGGTDPGSGRAIRGGYQETADATARSLSNRVATVLRPLGEDAASLGRVRDILTGNMPRGATPAERTAAARLRTMLDDHHAWLSKRLGDAQRDMGYVRGRYFPRRFDAEAIQADLDGFVTDATALYRRMGLSVDQAKLAADEWANRVMGIGGGARYADTPASAYTKGRTLPPDADQAMRKWMVTDPRVALNDYFDGSVRHAEFVSRFGPNGQKFDEVLKGMRAAGATTTEIDILKRAFASSTGTAAAGTNPTTGLLSWVQMHGMRMLLTRALFSSAAEPLATGLRSGNLADGFTALGNTWRRFLTPDSWQGTAMKMDQERAEMLGVVGDAQREMLMAARVESQNLRTRDATRINQMLNITGQNRLFAASRIASSRVAEHTIAKLAQDTGPGARRALAELGMDDAAATAVAAWLRRHDGKPPVSELIGDTPAANAYRTAVNRFVNESIVNPQAIDRPTGAGERHPLAQLAYGIMSFQYAFTRNVLIRSIKSADAALRGGNGLTASDRMMLLAPMAGLAVLAAAQFGMSNVRDVVFNRQAKQERPPFVTTVLAMDRAGLFGNLSPLVNLVTSAKYERDASGSMIGPYLGTMLRQAGDIGLGTIPQDMGGPNSPNTNNAEWAAVRSAWSLVAAPAMVGALAATPMPAWLKPAAGAGAMYVGSSDMSRSVATAAVGPRDVAPRTPGRGQNAPRGGGIAAGGGISAR